MMELPKADSGEIPGYDERADSDEPEHTNQHVGGMENYIEASLVFLESEEMRDYLREELPKFRWNAMACADIVAYAPASIEQKLAALERIAKEAEPEPAWDGEPFTKYAAAFARACRMALEERYSGPEHAMFWLRGESYDEDMYSYILDSDISFYTTFFTEFDAAVRYLEKLANEEPDIYGFEGLSYTITKYVPNGGGGLKEYCTWYLNNAREICYFDYEEAPEGWESLIDYCGSGLNLPVPFQPGDIVTADCLPCAPPCRVLILEVGDNRDCCCLQVLSIGEGGRLFANAFKHNSFLRHPEGSYVSGLYRAVRWTGELNAGEEPFAVLSPLICAKPELGIEIGNYVHNGAKGRDWPEVKEAFGL